MDTEKIRDYAWRLILDGAQDRIDNDTDNGADGLTPQEQQQARVVAHNVVRGLRQQQRPEATRRDDAKAPG